jgi:hypothetical protein
MSPSTFGNIVLRILGFGLVLPIKYDSKHTLEL